MTVLLVGNLVIGFNTFLEIVLLDVYSNFMGYDAGQATEHMAIFAFPKSFMLFYGLITDNVPLFGSQRKSWLLVSIAINIIMVTVASIL